MPNHQSSHRGVSWRAPLLALFAVMAMAATVVQPGSTAFPDAAGAPDTMSLSMVELLGDETASGPLMLSDIQVVGHQQRLSGYDGTGIDVALIDSGVAPVDGLDGDNLIHGPDLSAEGAIPEVAYLDTYGHGTHMAGIIAGQRSGHEGVAPDARIVSLKVAGADGVTTVPQVVAAIDWVVEHRNRDGLNIRVLNLSLGQGAVDDHRGDLLSAAVERAWDAGIFVVVAAGNDGDAQAHLDSPAIDPHVMAVAAVDSTTGEKKRHWTPPTWSGQGDGVRNPDVAAPGVSIASYRVPGSTVDELAPTARLADELFLGSGTSQAAAVVSGSAANLLEQYPEFTPDELKATLVNTSLTASDDEPKIGAGVVRGGVAWQNPEHGTAPQNHPRAAGSDTGIVAPTGATWTGGQWAGATWTGATWTGATWTGATWTGGQWAGATWTGATWSGATWSGATWSGNGWA